MILLYHNIVPDTTSPGHAYTSITLPRSSFERQVNWLADRFRILPLDDYLDYRQQSNIQILENPCAHFRRWFSQQLRLRRSGARKKAYSGDFLHNNTALGRRGIAVGRLFECSML